MPKRFFFLTKSQRIATLTLILIIVVIVLIDIFLPQILPSQESFFDPKFTEEIKLFEQQLDSFESTNIIVSQHHYSEKKINTTPKKNVFFEFDPNTLDSVGFVQLGLKPYIAKNVLRYRAKGGVFRKKTDFKKIYGISPNFFKEIEPYIVISPEFQQSKTTTNSPKEKEQSSDTIIIIELNSADTTQLKKLKGIGSSFAKRIVSYRKRLGGYVEVKQLLEVYGMNQNLFEKIEPQLKVNPQNIQKIAINYWSVARMRNHPYMNFYQAKAIFDLRKMIEQIDSIEELRHLEEFDSNDLKRLEPYLSFEYDNKKTKK